MYVMRDDERPLRFIQSVQGFPHLLFFLLFQQAVFRRFFFRRSPIIGEIGDDRECKIVCVNRYCMNLLYAPYWGKQR